MEKYITGHKNKESLRTQKFSNAEADLNVK
jgi:hypothetical protein